MISTHPLLPKLKQLNLSGMLNTLEIRSDQALQETLSSFDFNASVGVNCSFISDLASCSFIQRHENILFCGPPGVGKSTLANALGVEALKRNFRVISKPTYRLLTDLNASRANGTFTRNIGAVLRCDLLIMDDFGLQALTPSSIQGLYEIICERYETGSILGDFQSRI